MEPLLQAHVITPARDDERHDELITLFDEHGLRSTNDGHLTADRDDIEVASTLFEDRPDNREMLRELRAAIQDLFDDVDVFWNEHEHTFGEQLSTGGPHYHVVFEVVNVDSEPSRIRWQTHAKTLDALPRTDGEQLYHADHEEVFAIDAATGDLLATRPNWSVASEREGENPNAACRDRVLASRYGLPESAIPSL